MHFVIHIRTELHRGIIFRNTLLCILIQDKIYIIEKRNLDTDMILSHENVHYRDSI